MTTLLSIFFQVLAPVFSLVALGYIIGPQLELQPRTLSRFALTILTPAFIFHVLSGATIEADLAVRMTIYIVVVHVCCALIAGLVALLLRRSAQMIAAYALMAVFGNVGNFGLPIIQFALGDDALVAATVYFLAISVTAFIVGVSAANWDKGTRFEAVLAVIKTPAILAIIPAIVVNSFQIELPLAVVRPIELLAGAMVPTMLVTLGVQLAQSGIQRPTLDMIAASSVRLLVGPALAIVFAIPFGITGLERGVGILQSSMPIAILTGIIASEHNLLPGFVTATILFSTLVSVVTLALVVQVVQASWI